MTLNQLYDMRAFGRRLFPALPFGPASTPPPMPEADGDEATALTLRLSNERPGRAIGKFLRWHARTLPDQPGVPVLTLSGDPADYLKGRARQAVRTNIAKATLAGLTSHRASPQEARDAARSTLAAGINIAPRHLRAYAREQHGEGMVDWLGRDADGAPIAFGRADVDGSVAMLKCLIAVRDDDRSIIRYRMSADFFMALAASGVRHLVLQMTEAPPPGAVYFRKRLGFAPAIITVQTDPGTIAQRPYAAAI